MTFYRNEAKGSLTNGEQWTFTLHTQKTAGVLADAHSAWVAAVNDLWDGITPPDDSITQLFCDSLTVDELVTTELDAVTGKNVAQTRSQPALAGTGTADCLPHEVAVAVSLRTALPTHAGRGRFYLPSPTLDECVEARLRSSAQLSILNASVLMLEDLITSTYVPVIYHRSSKTGTVLTSIDVGDVFDSQRRRRDKLVEVRQSSTL